MPDLHTITKILVVVGAAVITGSVFWGLKTRVEVTPDLRGRWSVLIALMAFFILGYLVFVYALSADIPIPLEVLTGLVFFGGACFVYLVAKLSNASVHAITNKEEETRRYLKELIARTDDLEQEIAERYRAENDLKASERFLSSIFDSINDPFCIFDRSFRIVKANEQYALLNNRPLDDLPGRVCYTLEGRDSPCKDCLVKRTLLSKDPCAKEKKVVNKDGPDTWLELYTYPMLDEHGNVSHVIEYSRDITDRKRLAAEREQILESLARLSRTDQLTNLMNRRGLIDVLDREVERAHRYRADLALIICDVDRFKTINDTYGHSAGDKVLVGVAQTINKLLRKSDVAGRYGGDEFMIILPETTASGARRFAERIRKEVEAIRVDVGQERNITVSLSLGVAGFSPHMHRSDDIIIPADNALYASKAQGRNRVTLHSAPG